MLERPFLTLVSEAQETVHKETFLGERSKMVPLRGRAKAWLTYVGAGGRALKGTPGWAANERGSSQRDLFPSYAHSGNSHHH